MSYVKSLELPRVGEPVESARVVHWNVQPGDRFAEGDVLLEIDTDKTVLEVPAEESGRLVEHLVQVDDMIGSDTAIARIEVAGEAPTSDELGDSLSEDEGPSPELTSGEKLHPGSHADVDDGADQGSRESMRSGVGGDERPASRIFATPIARRLAAEKGLELANIQGYGPRGRITRADVLRASPPPAESARPSDTWTQPLINDQAVTTAHGELYVRTWTPAHSVAPMTVVLIHGLFADIDAWQGTARSLCRAGYRVVAMDLPCHGQSRSGATQLGDVVEAVGETVARVCAPPVALVGHSFGAAIAARVSRKPDLEIRSLMLIAPVGLGTEINQSFLTGMTHAGSIAALEREMRKLTVSAATPSGQYLQTLRERLESQADALVALCREVSWSGVQQMDITSDLTALECPITIVHGRSDQIVPWEHTLNAPARAALHLVPGAGHMPQWESTALIGELIERAASAA